MLRSSKKLLVVGVLLVAALLVMASTSEACWGWGCCRASYYTPYYASWCSPCYTPCYSSCYYPCWGTCGWGGCGYGYGYGYGCGYGCGGCCWNSCCTTAVSSCCGDVGSVSVEATVESPAQQQPTMAPLEGQAPATDTMPADMDSTVPSNTSTSLPTRQTSGLLTVWVPANAKVFINGKETTTQGTRRRYVSYGLQSGLTYKYEIRAEVARNGMLAEEEKTVYMTAGAAEGVAFGFNREPSNQVAAQQ